MIFSLIIIAYSSTQCYGNQILVQKYASLPWEDMPYDLPIKIAYQQLWAPVANI